MKEHIIWCEGDETYKASYYNYLERIVVRKIDTNTIVLIYDKMSLFDWKVFKLRILKWKKIPVQDVGK